MWLEQKWHVCWSILYRILLRYHLDEISKVEVRKITLHMLSEGRPTQNA